MMLLHCSLVECLPYFVHVTNTSIIAKTRSLKAYNHLKSSLIKLPYSSFFVPVVLGILCTRDECFRIAKTAVFKTKSFKNVSLLKPQYSSFRESTCISMVVFVIFVLRSCLKRGRVPQVLQITCCLTFRYFGHQRQSYKCDYGVEYCQGR